MPKTTALAITWNDNSPFLLYDSADYLYRRGVFEKEIELLKHATHTTAYPRLTFATVWNALLKIPRSLFKKQILLTIGQRGETYL